MNENNKCFNNLSILCNLAVRWKSSDFGIMQESEYLVLKHNSGTAPNPSIPPSSVPEASLDLFEKKKKNNPVLVFFLQPSGRSIVIMGPLHFSLAAAVGFSSSWAECNFCNGVQVLLCLGVS